MTERNVLIVCGVILIGHGVLTIVDHLSRQASTGAYDWADRAENPKRFKFNMRWNIVIFAFASLIWTVAAYDEFLR